MRSHIRYDVWRRSELSWLEGTLVAWRFALASAAALLLTVAPAVAQSSKEYRSVDDRFSASFPAEPSVRPTMYETEYEIVLPARVHIVENSGGKYMVTVVNWHGAEKVHEARFATCRTSGSSACANTWRDELGGSVPHAAAAFLARGSQVIHFGLYDVDGVEGLKLELVNQDGSRTSAAISWHQYRLYIVEATAPKGGAGQEAFAASFGFIDAEGRRIPVPQRAQ